jgi:hypothetical protein
MHVVVPVYLPHTHTYTHNGPIITAVAETPCIAGRHVGINTSLTDSKIQLYCSHEKSNVQGSYPVPLPGIE